MFPEYESFSRNPWNLARLTPRQHFIAHLILWKVYPNISSQFNALWQMKHKNNEKVNSRLYESILLNHGKVMSKRLKNTISVYDKNGKFQRVSTDEYDERVHTPISAGRVVAKTSNGERVVVTTEEFRRRNDLQGNTKNTKAWNDGNKTIYSTNKPSEEFVAGLLPISDKEKIQRNKKIQNAIASRSPEKDAKIRKRMSDAKIQYYANLSQEERKKSTDTRKKMSEAALKKNPGFSAICKCPKCGKEGQKANISRHHGIDGKKCKW